MAPTFSVSSERREAFVEMALEIVAWRLQDYLLGGNGSIGALPLPSEPQVPTSGHLEELG